MSVRSFEWRLRLTPEDADRRLRAACQDLGASPEGEPQKFRARTKTSFLRNRWSAELSVDISAAPYGSVAIILVEMTSPQHDAIISDLSRRLDKDSFASDSDVQEVEGIPGGRQSEVRRLRAQYGGNDTDVWAVGQPGSGFLRFDGRTVHIEHSGALSRLTVGKGSKRIPISQITAMHLKPAGAVVSGYLQFSIGGAVESRSQFGRSSYDAAGDENSIMFTQNEQPFFEAFREAVEQAIAAERQAQVSAAPDQDFVGQLKGIAELRESGVLTEEEFQQKKAEILRRM